MEWRAIEAEIRYPLSRVVGDIENSLLRKSFHDRIAADPAWA